MAIQIATFATCDNCARLFKETIRRYFCDHCKKYFFICTACSTECAHCRFCGVPLKKSTELRNKLVLK
jgi:hypothetical protein